MKDYKRQAEVWKDVIMQKLSRDKSIIGLMLESHLYEGSQPFHPDAFYIKIRRFHNRCLHGWEETERIILEAHTWLKENR